MPYPKNRKSPGWLPLVPLTISGRGVAIVHLSRGKHAIIDVADWPLVSRFVRRWSYSNGYAATMREVNGRLRSVSIHRLIMGLDGPHVDHENRNKLDCRRSNLRVATVAQNGQNARHDNRRGKTSAFKGVSWSTNCKRWTAYICANGRHRRLGSYDVERDAALAYDQAARVLHGEFAVLNFPNVSDYSSVLKRTHGLSGRRTHKRAGATSRFKGVSRAGSRWTACIGLHRRAIHLGTFDREEDAARAYDAKARELHGEQGVLNFPG